MATRVAPMVKKNLFDVMYVVAVCGTGRRCIYKIKVIGEAGLVDNVREAYSAYQKHGFIDEKAKVYTGDDIDDISSTLTSSRDSTCVHSKIELKKKFYPRLPFSCPFFQTPKQIF